MKKNTHNQSVEAVYKVGELVPKYVRYIETNEKKIQSSHSAVNLLRKFYDDDQIRYREFFYVMYLSRANEVMGVVKVSEGGISATVVDPKVIFAQALLIGASAMILSHNHPSNNLKPSEQDINLTKKLKEGAGFLEIQLLDHVILTDNSFYSFADDGLI